MAILGGRTVAFGALIALIQQQQITGDSEASTDGGRHHGQKGEKQRTG
jgi:hypothetical protein